jgi:hypothetical protein
MFYIKAMQGNEAVRLAYGKKITIDQPFNGKPVDTDMLPFVLKNDSIKGWVPPRKDSAFAQNSVTWTTTNYIYSMYYFNNPLDSGTWCNSDNPTYFAKYPQTLLTLRPLSSYKDYPMEVFLVFSNINSMVHVYRSGDYFPYHYAPSGLQCNVVAVGEKEGKIYASFTPITISDKLTVDFSLTEMTGEDFKTKLKALD